MRMNREIRMVALDSKTGLVLRDANPFEIRMFHKGQKHPRYKAGSVCFSENVRVGGVVVSSDNGPGA